MIDKRVETSRNDWLTSRNEWYTSKSEKKRLVNE